MWFKAHPEQLKGRNPDKYWKQLVCNHFINGQSKNRNDFCYIPNAVKEALSEEVRPSYHIIGTEMPMLTVMTGSRKKTR